MSKISRIFYVLLLGLVSCSHDTHAYQPRPGIEFRLGELQDGPGLQAIPWPDGRRTAYLHPGLVLGSRDIQYLQERQSDDGQWKVDFMFTAQGGQRMRQATEANIGHPMAITVDGKLASFATISGPIQERLELTADSAAGAQALIDQFALKH